MVRLLPLTIVVKPVLMSSTTRTRSSNSSIRIIRLRSIRDGKEAVRPNCVYTEWKEVLTTREYLLADKKKRLTEIREKENQEYQAKRATI
jgi:hypothetical protein